MGEKFVKKDDPRNYSNFIIQPKIDITNKIQLVEL